MGHRDYPHSRCHTTTPSCRGRRARARTETIGEGNEDLCEWMTKISRVKVASTSGERIWSFSYELLR